MHLLKHQGKTRTTVDEHGTKIRDHWDGRRDVKVSPKAVKITVKTNEEG